MNGITSLEEVAMLIVGFELYSSMYSGLPIGFFEVADAKGRAVIDGFDNLQVGAIVDLKLTSNNDLGEEMNDFQLTDFVILKHEIINQDENDTNVAGNLRVWFGHRLFLYKDMQNHAYPPLKNNDIVKRVLESEDRGFSIKIKQEDMDADDGVAVSRYKCNESDWEFLQRKVVRYASSEKQPLFLFCDIKQRFYFKSFKSMLNAEPKILFTPSSVDDEDETAFNEFKSAYVGVKYSDVFKKVEARIGGTPMIAELQKRFSVEDGQLKKVYTGIKTPSNTSGAEGALSKYIPVDTGFVVASSGTSSFNIRNHDMTDAFAHLAAQAKELDKAFTVTFDVGFLPYACTIGESILIYIKKGHWMNGKWLITDIDIEASDTAPNSLVQHMTVRRPSFDGNKSDTTLESLSMLHEVI